MKATRFSFLSTWFGRKHRNKEGRTYIEFFCSEIHSDACPACYEGKCVQQVFSYENEYDFTVLHDRRKELS